MFRKEISSRSPPFLVAKQNACVCRLVFLRIFASQSKFENPLPLEKRQKYTNYGERSYLQCIRTCTRIYTYELSIVVYSIHAKAVWTWSLHYISFYLRCWIKSKRKNVIFSVRVPRGFFLVLPPPPFPRLFRTNRSICCCCQTFRVWKSSFLIYR